MLKNGEHFEPLGNGVEVIVNDLFHFSTDTILLADFAAPRKNSKAVDLGTGCGTIPLLWCRNDRTLEITAVEIQPEACDMFARSVKHNALSNIEIINTDLKMLKGVIPFGYFDLVCCNPPYKLGGGGIKNPDTEKLLARHEESCTLDDIAKTAKNLLQFGGRFCMCQRPERLTDVLETMRKNSLEPKRLRFVQQRTDKKPKLFLVEGRRSAKSGSLVVEPTLFIEENGSLSEEMKKIYGSYKEGHYE
ncbi:MAG: methyltransferase [Ruminococcus sp.]|nr:methyltransferase [Ruminococcus sp.]